MIGSLVASFYSSRVEDATGALPAEQATAASDSVGAAVRIADGLPGSAGAALEHAAANAYTEALGLGLLAAAAVALVGAAVVSRLLPAHHRRGRAGAEGAAGRRCGGRGHRARLSALVLLRGVAR